MPNLDGRICACRAEKVWFTPEIDVKMGLRAEAGNLGLERGAGEVGKG